MDADIYEFSQWYEEHRRRSAGRAPSPVTVRNKTVQIRASLARLGAVFEGSPPSLAECLASRKDFQRLLFHLERTMQPGSVRNVLFALRDYGDFLVWRGDISEHVIVSDDFPSKDPAPPIEVYRADDMKRMEQAAWGKGPRWGCFIGFLTHTGRRIGETLNLRYDALYLDETPAYVLLPETKNGQPNYVPLDSYLRLDCLTEENLGRMRTETRNGIRQWKRSQEEYLFPWSYGTAKQMLDNFCQKLGIDPKGFHNFRHTVITQRLAEGMPIQAVAALAGHANVGITDARYNHTSSLTYAHLLP